MSGLTQQLAANLPEGAGPGPEWVAALRETAAGQFREHGLPTRRDEAWKYTSLQKLEQRGMQLSGRADKPGTPATRANSLLEAAYQVNMIDGRLTDQHGQLPEGLTVMPLAEALEQDMGALRALLESLPVGQRGAASADGFASLNTATLEHGLFIHVATGVDAGSLALNWVAAVHDAEILVNTRVCIVLEEGAGLQLFEQFENTCTSNCNIVVQAALEAR
ncbi:MAG: hypothetical protein OQJ84_08595, partial [Xanthomonadales bacterium]|nr:hypothetical protein [Xanthomonadales bacterium]